MEQRSYTCKAQRPPSDSAPPLSKKLLIPWTDPSFLTQSVSIRLKTPSTILMTDASKSGWGGICLPFATSGHWPMDLRHRSMNYLELKAIQNTIQHFAKTLKGKTVTLLTDNTTAAACIRRQGTLRSPSLLSLTTQILLKCKSYKINLVPKYLPGRLNALADSASRSSPIHGNGPWTQTCSDTYGGTTAGSNRPVFKSTTKLN